MALTVLAMPAGYELQATRDRWNIESDDAEPDYDETCPRCGGDAGENWFDRSLCASEWMHTRCRGCGYALDGPCCKEQA